MAVKVSAPVTIFKVSKALRISKKIIPRLKYIFKVKVSAKNKKEKKGMICQAVAWVRLSG